MDGSTEGVTLFAVFLLGVRDQYKGTERSFAPIFEMTKDLDGSQPFAKVPMKVFNDMCAFIETRVGASGIRRAGEAVGRAAYDQMIADGAVGAKPSPTVILRELKRVADMMIQDPQGRGWVIVDEQPNRTRMRRTQTFNCVLQEGLLNSLVERTGAPIAVVDHARCTRRGDAFCEYDVSWAGKF